MSKHQAPRGRLKAATPMVGATHGKPRCSARSSRTGKPCQRWPIDGGTVCIMHGGSAPQVKQAAMERLRALQDPAIDALAWLIQQREFPSAAYSAARDVMDRTEGKPAETVALQHSGGIIVEWGGK